MIQPNATLRIVQWRELDHPAQAMGISEGELATMVPSPKADWVPITDGDLIAQHVASLSAD
ncbi:MAG: hypothetical protein AAF411_23255 [Myxococcota bacterium]